MYLPDGSPAPIGASNIAEAQFPRVAPFTINLWWYPDTDAGEVDSHVLRHVATWDEAFEGTCYAVDRVLRDIPERGLLDSTLISRTKNPDSTFDVVLAEYNAAKFTEERRPLVRL